MPNKDGEYIPTGNDVIAVVEAVDAYSHPQVIAVLTRQMTRAYQMGLGARDLPETVKECLLTAWGTYEALELAIGADQVHAVLPGFGRCRERLRALLHVYELDT
jgi:hypothetical protein